jgi:hypothetical protein
MPSAVPNSQTRRPIGAGAVGEHAVADATRQVDQRAEHPFGDRRREAGAGMGDEHAVGARRFDIDVADIHRAAQEDGELRAGGKQLGTARRAAVADDDLAALGGGGERAAVENFGALVEPHLAERTQAGQRLVTVVVGARPGLEAEEDRRHRRVQTPMARGSHNEIAGM